MTGSDTLRLPSARTRLNECRARRMHVTDMPKDVQHLYWRDEEHRAREQMIECRRYPSEFSHLEAAAEDDMAFAHAKRLEHIARRKMVRGYVREVA